MNILILEDEAYTARDLQKAILQSRPDAHIAAIISNVAEAKEYLVSQPDIDLIFSDIQLGDGLSFEIFETLQTSIPVVFCTAHDEYALKAFKSFGIDYILKPFSPEVVAGSLDKFLRISQKGKSPEKIDYSGILDELKKKIHQSTTMPSIILYQGDKMVPVEGDTIALFIIESEMVYAITFQSKKLLTHYKMDVLERKFSYYFFRANRQFLINRKAIKEVSQHFHRKLQVNLTIPFSEAILVGKEKATAFIEWLAK